MYTIEFYDFENGKSPVIDFINALEPKMQAKVLRSIDLLEQFGPMLREPYSKLLVDGIFELRTKQGSDITQVLYFFMIGKTIVLTNGFVKKSKKTPPSEIRLAQNYRADYERRHTK